MIQAIILTQTFSLLGTNFLFLLGTDELTGDICYLYSRFYALQVCRKFLFTFVLFVFRVQCNCCCYHVIGKPKTWTESHHERDPSVRCHSSFLSFVPVL